MDLARAKGEALVNILIIYSNEKYHRVMLNGVGNENGKKDNNNNNFARAAHFFVHLFAVVACVPVRFFFLCRSFSPCWPLLASISFSHRRYKIFMLLFQRNSASSFFISRSSSLSLFFSLSFASLSPTFTFSLTLSFSTFQICGHDN